MIAQLSLDLSVGAPRAVDVDRPAREQETMLRSLMSRRAATGRHCWYFRVTLRARR